MVHCDAALFCVAEADRRAKKVHRDSLIWVGSGMTGPASHPEPAGTAKATSSCHARDLVLHHAQNPFLEHTGPATTVEQMSGLSVPTYQTAKRSILLQPSQVLCIFATFHGH